MQLLFLNPHSTRVVGVVMSELQIDACGLKATGVLGMNFCLICPDLSISRSDTPIMTLQTCCRTRSTSLGVAPVTQNISLCACPHLHFPLCSHAHLDEMPVMNPGSMCNFG